MLPLSWVLVSVSSSNIAVILVCGVGVGGSGNVGGIGMVLVSELLVSSHQPMDILLSFKRVNNMKTA